MAGKAFRNLHIMARIAGIDLPREKRLETALTYIYGIGPTSAKKIVAEVGLTENPRVRELSEADSAKLREIIERDYRVEGDLRRTVTGDIKRLVEIQSYRGTRHRRGLPVRGQRTKTNARTRKGPRKTVGVKRKK
jgi:small subunit ribosomal protein S13